MTLVTAPLSEYGSESASHPFRDNGSDHFFPMEREFLRAGPGWSAVDGGGYGRFDGSPNARLSSPFPHPLLTARARLGIGRFLSPNKETQLKLGGSKARALLGGVAVIAILGVVASEVGAGPASAARQQASRTESARPHGVRPVAAILQNTPLSLAGELAAQHYRTVAEQRAAIVRWVSGIQAAKAQAEAEAAAAAAAVRVQGARVTRNSAPAPDYSGAVPTDGEHGGTLACIRAHESDSAGGYSAVNSSSGAGGAYQALPSTWDGYSGYARAQDAPPEVQDQWAREAISASGTRPWAGSGC